MTASISNSSSEHIVELKKKVETKKDKTEFQGRKVKKLEVDNGDISESTGSGKTDAKKKCDKQAAKDALKWTAVALVILGVVVGIVGALVYSGVLQIQCNGMMMSTAAGMYTIIAGMGAAALLSILLIVNAVVSKQKKNKIGDSEDKSDQPYCANICNTKKKNKNSESTESTTSK